MGDFSLVKVGDFVTKKGFYNGQYEVATEPQFHRGYGYVCYFWRNKEKHEVCPLTADIADAKGTLDASVVAIHRPTPEGLVQVWPEVEE